MTISILVALVVVAGVAVLWHLGSKPARYRRLNAGRIQSLVRTLLYRGFDGGALFVEDRSGTRFVQLTKYVSSHEAGIQLDFPRAPWSEPFYDRARSRMQELGLSPKEASTWRSDTMAFVTVDLQHDVDAATRLVIALCLDVLGIDLEHEAIAYFTGVSNDPDARIGL